MSDVLPTKNLKVIFSPPKNHRRLTSNRIDLLDSPAKFGPPRTPLMVHNHELTMALLYSGGVLMMAFSDVLRRNVYEVVRCKKMSANVNPGGKINKFVIKKPN